MARDHILQHITMTLYRELKRCPNQREIMARIREGKPAWRLTEFLMSPTNSDSS